jgi:N-acetylglutamate synthase-like GNAT family acetyltransferase
MTVQLQYRAANKSDLPRVKRLLGENGLPGLGVDDWIENFVVAEEQNGLLVGVAGLELYSRIGLLRSVAVDKPRRGEGHGRVLVDLIVRNAKTLGVKMLYLLTDDAVLYFERLGFQTVDRKYVDEGVKASVEFTEMCESAAVMRRAIN